MREELKKLRKEKDMTQEQIAKKVGIHRTHYTNIERGHANPSIKVMIEIKKVLKTQRDDIFLIKNVENIHEKSLEVS
ncbi:transcriptional regulator [Orenia metallireducens]|uniref:Transcriptional regulator n=1 Tax=Orenia metallireducens TaxID=1413210 RepID=A0A1C0A7R6_9FIRM|nr:helix-turn-helix transcriptional regulator [Orenia metallireducens]OCL26286.1 transcriptional regulator [Orenia metallireducens]